MGFWAEMSDVVGSDPAKTSGSSLVSPPSGWPKCFSENATLKGLMGKKNLAGKRCRLTGAPSKEDMGKLDGVQIDPEDPFGNAERISQACGWQVIKGYVVYELGGADAGNFVAHKRWWNQKDSGVWLDATPRLPGIGDMVLLESALSTKTQMALSAGVRAAAKSRLALGGLVAGTGKAAAPAAPAAKPAKPAPSKPKPKPPPTPAKLEFKGSESLEEMLVILSKGTPQAQTRVAAAIAAQAATGPVESKRIVAAGGMQPLLLMLRREGDVQDHAARAIMSARAPPPPRPSSPRPAAPAVEAGRLPSAPLRCTALPPPPSCPLPPPMASHPHPLHLQRAPPPPSTRPHPLPCAVRSHHPSARHRPR